MKIALIPAKLNSTRVKNKNFRMFNGKPMIFWSIETAKKSKLFDKIVVTTDNQIVKNKLSKLAVDVFIRPKKLSQEKIGIRDVVDHFLKNIEYKKKIKYVCCIYPCVPLLNKIDILEGYKKIKTKRYKYVFAASNFSHPIEKSFRLKKNKIKMVFKKVNLKKSSKIMDTAFHDVGYFYWAKTSTWIKNNISYVNNCSFVKIPNWRAQDLDTSDDFKKVDLIFKSLKKKL